MNALASLSPSVTDDMFRAICDAASDAIFIKDVHGTYIYANPVCAQLFGTTVDRVLGSNDDVWFGPLVGARLRALDARVRETSEPCVYEQELGPEGSPRPIMSTSKTPFRDAEGRTVGVIGIARDVTAARREQRAIRAERDMYAAIGKVAPGALVSFRLDDRGLVWQFVSEALATLVGAGSQALALCDWLRAGDRARLVSAVRASATTLAPVREDCCIEHPTRGDVWIEIAAAPVLDPEDGLIWHGVVIQIDERKRTERELREQRDRIRGIAEASPGALYSFRRTIDGVVSVPYASEAMRDLYGASPDELLCRPEIVFERIAPADRSRVQASIAESARTMTPWRCEYQIDHPTRGALWADGHSRPVRELDGSITWHGVLLDVTEHRRLERDLREQRDRFAAIVETAPGMIYTYRVRPDGSFDFPYVAPAISEVFYATVDEIHTNPALVFERMHADDLPGLMASIAESAAQLSVWVHEFRVPHPTRGEVWLQGRSRPTLEPDGTLCWHGILVDTTQRRRGELALAESERRYRSLIELLPDAVIIDTDDSISFCNQAFLTMMGASRSTQVLGKSPLEVFHPDDHAPIERSRAELRQHRSPGLPREQTLIALDGSPRPVSVVATEIGQENVVVIHDLTERQRAERLLRSVLESVNDAILTIDARGTVLSCNPATTRLFGYEAGDLIGHNVSILMSEEHAVAHDGYLARYLRTEQSRLIGTDREVMGQRKDGSTFPIELSVTSFRLNDAQHFTGVIRDITARKRLEEQFRQAHKMEAFGQLAGGVAHDFNNLLTVILGTTEYVVDALDDTGAGGDETIRAMLSDVYDAGQRAASMTRQLLAFSRKTVLEPKILDINAIVHDLERMLRRLLGEDLTLTTQLAPDLAHVNVDPGQLTQVLMNLAVNARDAMPAGGTLSIETENRHLRAHEARELDVTPGDYVELRVRDSGCGMADEVRVRAFQPFFTTKEVGKGTGLGLAVVHGIVAQSGGAITVSSQVGHGTEFRIMLPVAERPRSRTSTVTPDRSSGRETVLIVEDDEAIRRLALRTLEARGFRVLVAADGQSALDLLGTTEARIDIVVTDVVMPRMDGRRLGDAVRERFPAVRLLYVSGYTDDILVRRGLQAEQVDFLAKPYTPAALTQAVLRLLARPPSPA